MFVPCPHCQFLVTHHPQLRPLPADCPRCGRPLQEDIEAAAAGASGTTPGHDPDIAGGDGMHVDAPGADSAIGTSTHAGPGSGLAAFPDDARSADEAETPSTSAVGPMETDADHEPARPMQPAPAAAPEAPAATFAAPIVRGRWTRWRWPLIALLALLLALQILLADRAKLGEDPRWRPLVEAVCGTLHCSLPPWRQPEAFTMLDRKVRPASQPAGALRVDATFRNDARWAQAWPALELALSDADGRVLGSRVFQPADYLGAAPTTTLSPGQSAQITFMVQEPAPGTVAFSFEFR